MNSEVKTNSVKAWVLAARPKTLAGAALRVDVDGGQRDVAGRGV